MDSKTLNKNITLDIKHREKVNEFNNNNNNIIPKLTKELDTLILNSKKLKKNTDEYEINNNNIISIKNKIYNLTEDEKNYYLNNSKYIFMYFEDKKNINNNVNNNDNEIKSNELNYNNNKLTNKKINAFFCLDETNKDENDKIHENYQKDKKHENEIYENSENIKLFKNQDSNIDKYFYNINNVSIDYDNFCYKSDICKSCNKGEYIYIEGDGVCICNNCASTVKYFIENDKPSYKEPPKEVCFYAYKRINHLREILAQFQAKESTHIPDEIFENIKLQVKKERIDISSLTNKKTKEILKNLGYNKYYEHIPFIKDKLGIKPPIMSNELEETLCNLFMEIQKPYSKYCPKDRVNFLNYYYTLYKLCELLGETKFLPFFPMLKDREKRIEQDQIWKNICKELNWEFIPTI